MGNGTAKVGGVEFELRSARATGPGSARRAGEPQAERAAVALRPLVDDVVNENAVVLGGQYVGCAGGAGDVDAVHPGIAGEDDVDEIADRPVLLAAVDHLVVGKCPA